MVEAYLPPSYHQHLHLPLPAQNDIPSSPQENLLNLLLLHLLILLLKPFLFLHLLLLLLLPISFPLHLAILACSAFSWLALIIQSPVLPCKQPSLLPTPAFPPSTPSLPSFHPQPSLLPTQPSLLPTLVLGALATPCCCCLAPSCSCPCSCHLAEG